jgi:redox-sensitive bicupin YhaK (pirin superfamily)
MHKDSLGTEIEITPGQVNWMTAGKGIVHSERTPSYLRHSGKMLHGLQIWVALPKHHEQIDPSFFHASATDLPVWDKNGVDFKLIAGSFSGRESPVPVYSPLYFLELKTTEAREVQFDGALFGEAGLYILQGHIEADGETYGPKQLLVAKDSTLCNFTMAENTTVYIFGGGPFPEDRFIYWNFVASDQKYIDAAKSLWEAQGFDPVPGESGYIPLPLETGNLKPKK